MYLNSFSLDHKWDHFIRLSAEPWAYLKSGARTKEGFSKIVVTRVRFERVTSRKGGGVTKIDKWPTFGTFFFDFSPFQLFFLV